MKNYLSFSLILLLLITLFASPDTKKSVEELDYQVLTYAPQHPRVSSVISRILSQSHYQKKQIDDSLSSQMFDQYVQTLDYNRVFFLASDIDEFSRYRYQLDDYLKAGNVEPAFEIYNRFQIRFRQRQEHIYLLLQNEFDYDTDEYLMPNRSEEVWALSTDELDDLWRKIIKNETLRMRLKDKSWEDIVKTLTKRYKRMEKNIKQTESEDVFQWYMNAFAETFDPHTNYMSPKVSDDFKIKMSLALEGIGASLRSENDYTKVVEIVPGGPADKSDLLHPNDRICAVGQGREGEMVDIIGWRTDDVVLLIRGPKDTEVRLQILPADASEEDPRELITLTRDKIKLEDRAAQSDTLQIEHRGESYELGIIEIPAFYFDYEAMRQGDPDYKSTTRDVKRLLGELQSAGVDGIIIDLRNNSGGFLSEAIELTGLFIPSGPVVQVRSSYGKVKAENDFSGTTIFDGPLAVLINRFSASASEIFAAAIQDYGRGVIIGGQSFGKGTVQNVIQLDRFFPRKGKEDPKYGQVKMTIAKFYRINGGSTQHIGVMPDITFPSRYDVMEVGEDAQPNALQWDEIGKAKYTAMNEVFNQYVPRLRKQHMVRVHDNLEFQYMLEDIEEIKKQKENKLVSLQEEKRRQEREKAEARKKKRKAQREKVEEENGKAKADAFIIESGHILLDVKKIVMG